MQMWVLRMLMLEVENNTETDFLGPGREGPGAGCESLVGGRDERGKGSRSRELGEEGAAGGH